MNAEQLIQQAEREAKAAQERSGCDDATRNSFQVGWLNYELRKACAMLVAATNPGDCVDVTIDGITYGMQRDKGDECWLVYIGGQVINVALSGWLLDKLADEAERMALDGEAA